MMPLVVRAIPENGARNIALDTPIQLFLAVPIGWDHLRTTNFQLLSLTSNTQVAIPAFTVDQSRFAITLENPGLTPLHRYRLTVSGLRDTAGLPYTENYSLEFETIALTPASPAPSPAPFAKVFSYPAHNAKNIRPAIVRVRFNKSLDKAAMNLDLTDSDCAIRVLPTASYEQGDIFSIPGVIDPVDLARATDLVFSPTEAFSAGTSYTVLLQGVKSLAEGDELSVTLPDSSFSFFTQYAYAYVTVSQLTDIAPFLDEEIEAYGEDWFYRNLSRISEQLIVSLAEQAVTPDTSNLYFLDGIKASCICDVLLARITAIGTASTSKTLGNLEIQYARSMDDLLALYELWTKRRDSDLAKLIDPSGSTQTRVKAFVRGSDVDTAYDFMDRGMKSFDSTTKSW